MADSSNRLKGVVVSFFSRKGYGFIRDKEGKDYFVHYSDIKGKGFRTLVSGEEVEFSVREGSKGFQAFEVIRTKPPSPLSENPASDAVSSSTLSQRKW